MSEPKQIILMRTDLGMRKGKMVAQGAHASARMIIGYYNGFWNPWDAMERWLKYSFTKICVGVGSEEELNDLILRAQSAKLHATSIIDSGRTEFNGVLTKTCGAIGPEFPESLDPITGHLKLL
jgi:PTH2 family peptidyl-tRNA hydrolase